MIKILVLMLCFGSALKASAACPSWPTSERFTINGEEVTDKRTGLVWARCSVGQSWNSSTCTGTATTMTHEAALAYAQSRNGWRLSNVKELASLADKGCQNPAIDNVAFPNTPSKWYWSSSPYVENAAVTWMVLFYDGYVFGNNRGSAYGAVRLVRVSQ